MKPLLSSLTRLTPSTNRCTPLGSAKPDRSVPSISGLNGCITIRGCMSLIQRSEEHTSELQSRENLVCRLLLEKKKHKHNRLELQQQRAPAAEPVAERRPSSIAA